MSSGTKGVLVLADGRTVAVDSCIGAGWWVRRDPQTGLAQYFILADIARIIPNPMHPVWVYTERPEDDYRAARLAREVTP